MSPCLSTLTSSQPVAIDWQLILILVIDLVVNVSLRVAGIRRRKAAACANDQSSRSTVADNR
jgi:hypothetical protein